MYGLRLAAPWLAPADPSDVTIQLPDDAGSFPQYSALLSRPQRTAVFAQIKLNDGSRYLHWQRLVECIISADGSEVLVRSLGINGLDAFRSHLLAPTLSFILLDRGREVLHGGAVTFGGAGIAIIGDSGAGKSTLAAAMIAGGARSITDDLLVLPEHDGRHHILPGQARLKLFPSTAQALLSAARGSVPMNPFTDKRVYTLRESESIDRAVPLGSIWALTSSERGSDWSARRLSGAEAIRTLIANTFVTVETDAARQARLLNHAAALADRIPIYSLTLPQGLPRLLDQSFAIARELAALAA
jgi:hypothetical protein